MPPVPEQNLQSLIHNIVRLVDEAKSQVCQAVNSAMVFCYWDVGRTIIEHEQGGQSRAAYGKEQLQQLSTQLTQTLGKGFGVRNLRNMRAFYLAFPIRNSLRSELSWTHYRMLLRIEKPEIREWYINEAIEQGWSARALDRQIGVLYYERLLSSNNDCAGEKRQVVDNE